MIGRIQLIAHSIKAKLQDKPLRVSELEQHVSALQESDTENIDTCVRFLLATACELNLLQKMHDLLELNLFKDIDQPLHFEKKNNYELWGNGKTLLGLAAFHGHIELVGYLVEVKLANINTKDANGDTPLHQVVYGDSYPFNHCNNGTSHDKVAKYLIRHGGDLSIKNNKQQTPHDNTNWCAPLKVEEMLGRRFITNTGSAIYYADKVRPVFEKRQAQQRRDQYIPVITIGGERQAKSFDKFCLEHAVEVYVKDKKAAFGYSSVEELYHALDSLSEEGWKHMRMIISAQEPMGFSYKYGLISNKLPKLNKQSVLIGLMVAVGTYYETQDILLSVTAGSLSAVLAWSYLTETAFKQKLNKRSIAEQGVGELRQYDRFFKAPQAFNIQDRQQLDEIQNEMNSHSMRVRSLGYNNT